MPPEHPSPHILRLLAAVAAVMILTSVEMTSTAGAAITVDGAARHVAAAPARTTKKRVVKKAPARKKVVSRKIVKKVRPRSRVVRRRVVRKRAPVNKAVVAPPRPTAAQISAARSLTFAGLGAWADVYDWSPSVGSATFRVADVELAAARGAQVLYIQTSRFNRAEDVLDMDVLRSIIVRAHQLGLRVVGWYLPTYVDVNVDLRRFSAMAALGVDGIGVDIEDRTVTDVTTRNDRLVLEAATLRALNPAMPMSAIVLPPVVTDVINTAYWPSFPWTRIAPFFDVWMPMGYWTNRTVASGWRDAGRYTAENIDRIRSWLGNPAAPVHVVGGLAADATVDEVNAMVAAANARNAIGGSLYDNATSRADEYAALAPMRR